MSEIEFLDPVPAEADAIEGAETPARRVSALDPLAVIPAVLWLAAAALTVVACFGSVYHVIVDQELIRTTRSVDAWGRYGSGGNFGAHAVRYGIALSVCAAFLLAAAVLAAITLAQRSDALKPIGVLLGSVGLGGCAALTASMYLEIGALRDTIAAEVRSATSGDVSTSLVYEHIGTGTAVWFGIAASACAVLAIVAGPLIRRMTPTRAPDEPGAPLSGPEPDPDADPTEIAVG